MNRVSLIVIDPQNGFCSPSGSLGLFYGDDELSIIRETIHRIGKALEESDNRHLVVSEYSVGQFTSGELNHPLSNLCVPNKNNDCSVIDELSVHHFHSTSIKKEQSALSCNNFCSIIDSDIKGGTKLFAIAGFLTEHCIKSTVNDLVVKLKASGAEVVVCKDLIASRSCKYSNGEVRSAIASMENNGVTFRLWDEIMLRQQS